MSDQKSVSILSTQIAGEADALAERFNSAKPFRHLVLDDFFTEDFCQSLLDEFPAFDRKRARDENGNIGRKSTHNKVRKLGEPYVTLDDTIKSPEFLHWLGRATGIPDLIYDPEYFGGGTHENCHGQDLDPHVDFNKHPITGDYRRLNLIVYLNHEWDERWGGGIEFHKDPRLAPEQNEITCVTPLFNRCVIFETTHWSWHGFERINLPEGDKDPRSRKSLALYFYSKTRPKSEQTKPHSTIYVERPLPENIRPGVTLGDEEYQEIQRLLMRRDQHLQRLYHNISSLSAHVEGLEYRLRCANTPPDEPVPERPPSPPRWRVVAWHIRERLYRLLGKR